MAYDLNDIKLSQEIFYYLLEHKQLNDRDDGRLYKGFVENEVVRGLTKSQAEIAKVIIAQYNRTIYIIPQEDNNFLGYTKQELKKELCKGGALDKDYYLAQFVIIVFLMEFYDGQGQSSKIREYIKIGELQNKIEEYLQSGARQYDEEQQNANGLMFSRMLEAYSALRSSEKLNRQKTTKEGFLYNIFKFLEEQGLVQYIEREETVWPTEKLDVFIDFNILNQENFRRVLSVMSGIEEQADE